LLRFLQLSRTGTAGAAIAVLNFDQADDIESYLRRSVKLPELSDAMGAGLGIDSKSGDIPIGSLYGGFGELTQFLDNFRETTTRTLTLVGDDWTSINELIRLIAQLLRWRFYFIEQSPLLYKFVSAYLDALEIDDPGTRARFQIYIKSLAENWGEMQGPTPLTVTA
jgi:hypothetical protein